MFFLHDHLVEGSYRSLYADTDSISLATTRTADVSMTTPEQEVEAIFKPIVRPEMLKSWDANWRKWFVIDNSVEERRNPGKLKRKTPYNLQTVTISETLV